MKTKKYRVYVKAAIFGVSRYKATVRGTSKKVAILSFIERFPQYKDYGKLITAYLES